jgi:Putative Actinobacterial Holin-X, holin superfamily III
VDPVSQPDNEIPPSFGDLFRQLVDDITAYFDAERQIYGVQARITRRAAGWVALLALGAVVVSQGAMIALVVGLLLVLVPFIGAGWATTVVVLSCSIFAVLFVWLIRLKLRSVKTAWRRRHDG